MADVRLFRGVTLSIDAKFNMGQIEELINAIARSDKELKFMLNNIDSQNVTSLNTNITTISSEDGETIIDGPLLKMHDDTPTLRLELGWDGSDFIFSLKDEAGNETIGLDSDGDAVFSGELSSASGTFGGNVTGTIDETSATTVKDATVNFDTRNDRLSTTPANPVVASDGTAVDHTLNTDGSSNVSFEWTFTGSGNSYNIDGFKIFLRTSTSSSAYTMGTTPAEEKQYIVDYSKRAIIFEGIATDKYYTFGVQAYREVDQDVNSNGVLQSSIVQPSLSAENPYQPSSTVAFAGNVTGTIAGTSATTVKDSAANSVQQAAAYNTVTITSADGIVATRSDNKARTSIAAGEFLIEKGDGAGSWENQVSIDSNGNAVFSGELSSASGTFGGELSSASGTFEGDVTGTIDGTNATTVKDSAANSVQQDTAYNTVKITSANGIVATRSDDKARISISGGEFLIEKGDGAGSWENQVSIDADGNAIFKGTVQIGTDEKVIIEDVANKGNIRFLDSSDVEVGYIDIAEVAGNLRIVSETGKVLINSLTGDTDGRVAITSSGDLLFLATTNLDLFITGDLRINAATGWTGTFQDNTGKTVTVSKGIITNVV